MASRPPTPGPCGYILYAILSPDSRHTSVERNETSVSSVFEAVSFASTIVLGVCVQRGDHKAAGISQVCCCSLCHT